MAGELQNKNRATLFEGFLHSDLREWFQSKQSNIIHHQTGTLDRHQAFQLLISEKSKFGYFKARAIEKQTFVSKTTKL